MGRQLIKYGLMFVGLVLIQVLFLNQVRLGGYINPYIYVLFVLLLPGSAPRYTTLFLAFAMGITVDIFSNSLGLHAFATVFMAYLRPWVVRIISDRDEERSDYPGLKHNRFSWFLSYVSILVLLHHIVLFYLEVFTFNEFFTTLYRALLSSVFSIFIIVLSQFIVFRD